MGMMNLIKFSVTFLAVEGELNYWPIPLKCKQLYELEMLVQG